MCLMIEMIIVAPPMCYVQELCPLESLKCAAMYKTMLVNLGMLTLPCLDPIIDNVKPFSL